MPTLASTKESCKQSIQNGLMPEVFAHRDYLYIQIMKLLFGISPSLIIMACLLISPSFLSCSHSYFASSSPSAFSHSSTILPSPPCPIWTTRCLSLVPPCLSIYIKITCCRIQPPVLTAQGCSQACVCLRACLCMFVYFRGNEQMLS